MGKLSKMDIMQKEDDTTMTEDNPKMSAEDMKVTKSPLDAMNGVLGVFGTPTLELT